MKRHGFPLLSIFVLLSIMLISCLQNDYENVYINPIESAGAIEVWSFESDDPMQITATPFLPEASPVAEPPILLDEKEAEQSSNTQFNNNAKIRLWAAPYVPAGLVNVVKKNNVVEIVTERESADAVLLTSEGCSLKSEWVYAVVVPFPTVLDQIAYDDVQTIWQKGYSGKVPDIQLLMSPETSLLLQQNWGEPQGGGVSLREANELLDFAWQAKNMITIIPFEELAPRWKVLRVDGVSVLDQTFSIADYPLNFSFCLQNLPVAIGEEINLPSSNRESNKFTSVILTGVTALVRATAHKMEMQGILYPGEKIDDLLWQADFTHISNEVAFSDDCPFPNPYQSDLRFCSNPAYMELLNYLDIDIVELTGNHIQDWSRQAFMDTLAMYSANGIQYYAGGVNAVEARKPLLIEHNGNKIAFLGCNAVGPPGAWAGSDVSGNLPCGDYAWLIEDVKTLVSEGYLPIVTLQHNEFYSMMKTGPQIRDFHPLAEAGAVIVSGSQAHYPNPFGFVDDHFIHYGLGNLFFDQTDTYVAAGIQREFVDRHIFYNGQYINTEIYTLYLEDFAQPRLMTTAEREAFLAEAFLASGWK